jgi:hypothetical protein
LLLLVVHSHLPNKEWNGLDNVSTSFVGADFFGKDMKLETMWKSSAGGLPFLLLLKTLLLQEIPSLERLVLGHLCVETFSHLFVIFE